MKASPLHSKLAADRLLILLDYDGTLTDFKKNPDHSRISPRTRALLRRLKRKYPVIFVTGRYIDSLVKVSGLKGFPAVGTHGFEGRGLPGGLRLAPKSLEKKFRKEAARLWKALQALPRRFPGIHIERKPFSSTLHFRGLDLSPSAVRDLNRGFKDLFRGSVTRRSWKLQAGKQMIEAMPKGYSKGKAVRKILERFPGHVPLYAGDDIGDISVFKVLGKRGLRIAVGRRIPRKHYDLRFEKPEDLIEWLKNLC
jgi:trehalose-phosphatase